MGVSKPRREMMSAVGETPGSGDELTLLREQVELLRDQHALLRDQVKVLDHQVTVLDNTVTVLGQQVKVLDDQRQHSEAILAAAGVLLKDHLRRGG